MKLEQHRVADHWIDHPQGRIFARHWVPQVETVAAPIVLMHESLGCVEMWRDFPARLCNALQREVIAYDRLGFGKSDARHELPALHFVAEEATEVFPQLRAHFGITRFVAVGHSVGGGMVIETAAAYPQDCEAVITIGAQAFVEDITFNSIAAAGPIFDDPVQFNKLAKYHGEKTRWVIDAWIKNWLSPGFASWTLRDTLPKVQAPTLAMHGERDEYASLAQPTMIAERSNGRPARVDLLPGLGHVPFRENPDLVVQHIADFLAHARG